MPELKWWMLALAMGPAVASLTLAFGGEASASPTQHCLTGSTADQCLVQLDIGDTTNLGLANNFPLPSNLPYISGFFADAGYNSNQYHLQPNQVIFQLTANQYIFGTDTLQFKFSKIGLNLVDTNVTIDPATVSWSGPDAYLYCNTTNCTPFVHTANGQSMDGFGPFNLVLLTQPSTGLPGNDDLSMVLNFTDISSLVGDMLTTDILTCNHDTAHNANGGCGSSAAALVFADDLTNPDATALAGYAAWPDVVDDPLQVEAVPEPASIALFGAGLLGLCLRRRRSAISA